MKLDIPEKYQSIGVLYSGGIDSSLLLYLVGKQYPTRKIMAFTSNRKNVTDFIQISSSRNIYRKISSLLPKDALNYHIIHDGMDTTHGCEEAVQDFSNMVDVWIDGGNLVPPKNTMVMNCRREMVDIHEASGMPARKHPSKEIWWKEHDAVYYMPLRNMTKREVINVYHDLGIYEKILPLTRSCAKKYHAFDDLDHYTPECGECFFCLERKWGMM